MVEMSIYYLISGCSKQKQKAEEQHGIHAAAEIGAVMDNFNSTRSLLTEGLRDLPTDDIERVRHFLAEYLGDTNHPVPFGGRAQDFERLDNWLMEREGPPYALLAAPAGRGKSALLLRWCEHLLARRELAIIYFPVSIRFRTNLASVVFPALVALLARLHGENLPGDLHAHENVWLGLLHEYLTRPLPGGRQLLLVLDGVDEAADWDAGSWLLPEHPPSHLRVVLSARYLANDQDAGAWLTRLGWTRAGLACALELYPLDRSGIASVLTQMGFPLDQLSTRVDLVAELHRLSEGDPLLIRLYVDDLWQRGEHALGLTPEDLHAIRPGLIGYFERWWNEQRSLWAHEATQREAAVQTVLNLLAGALGPLSQEDILNLAPADSILRKGRVEQHLEPLGRFVIGDGMHQGYVFSHPRLAGYFLEERLSQAERQAIEECFLTWGASTLAELNAGELAPEKASPYIVQYYGAHLERAQAGASSFFALVSTGWRRAWEKLDRAYAGFLGDSERAWQAAARENSAAAGAGLSAPYLNEEIRGLLCRTSINSMASNISSRLMLEAVKTGVWTPAQGLASIRLLSDLAPRARELASLAAYLQEPLRTAILQEALDTILTLKGAHERLDTLIALAPGLPAGLLEQVLELVHAIEDEADRAGALAELAPVLARIPELQTRVLAIAREIEDEEYLVLALEGLTPVLSADQHLLLLAQAQNIEDDRYRAQAFTALVPHLPATLLQEILTASLTLRAGISQVRLLAKLVNALPEETREAALKESLELLSEIIDQEYRVEILLTLAPCLPAEEVRGVLTAIQELWDESYRARALRDLLPYLPQEQAPAFLDAALALKNDELRVSVLLQSLPYLSTPLPERCLESVAALWDEGLRVEMLARLAPLVSTDQLPRLLELASDIKDPGYRVWLQAELETSLTEQEHAVDLAQAFLDVRYTDERIQTLLAVVERISDEALSKVFAVMEPDIFGFYRSTLHSERQAEIFSKLAPRMPEAWLARTLRAIRALDKETYQVRALLALAPRINADLLPTALDIVRSMKTRDLRAQVLEAQVATLPEESKAERVREMLSILQVIKDESQRSATFNLFIDEPGSTFSAPHLAEVLAAIEVMRSEVNKAHLLATLARGAVAPDQYDVLLLAARQLWDEQERARVLTALAERLPERLLPGFLAVVQGLHQERWRASVLASMAERISPTSFPGVLALALDLHDQNEQTKVLVMLAGHLPESTFSHFWDAFQKVQLTGHRLWIFKALAAHVPLDYFAPFWQEVQNMGETGWQTATIRALLGHQRPETDAAHIWSIIQQTQDEQVLGMAIRALADHLPESLYPQVFQTAFDLCTAPAHPKRSAHLEQKNKEVLKELALCVPESFFLQFWHKIGALESRWERLSLREALVLKVPASCFVEIWNNIRIVEEENAERSNLWEKLLRNLPEQFFEQIWPVLKDLDDRWLKGKMLAAVAARVPQDFQAEFWQTTKVLSNTQMQVRILYELGPRLQPEMLTEVLAAAMNFTPEGIASSWLIWMASLLSEKQSTTFLRILLPEQWTQQELVSVFTNLQTKWSPGVWERLMLALAPNLPAELLQTILPALMQVALSHPRSEEDRVTLLAKLAVCCPESTLPNLLEATWSIQVEYGRQQVLTTLLPRLTRQGWSLVLAHALAQTRETGNTIYLLQLIQSAPATLQQSAPDQLYPILHDLLLQIAQRPRREALTALAMLTPALRALSSPETNLSIALTILEIGGWWP